MWEEKQNKKKKEQAELRLIDLFTFMSSLNFWEAKIVCFQAKYQWKWWK